MPKIDQIFRRYMQAEKIPGMVWGVVIDGRLAHMGTAGLRDRGSKAPVTADTAFRIASMTKSFTALAILKLRDEGKLSLDDPVSKWLPEFARMELPTRDTAPLRIRQLLSHSTGFPEDNPWGDQQLSASDAEITEWLRRGIPFSTPPDTRYEYSNYAFGLLGRVVTRASGMPYEKYVRAEILAKLHMDSSTFEFSQVPAESARSAIACGRTEPISGTASAARRFQFGGRAAHNGHGSRQVRRLPPFGVALARRRGDRARTPKFRARNEPHVDSFEPDGQLFWRHTTGGGNRLRIRPAHHHRLPLRAHRGPRRRVARFWFLHGVASRLRRRDVCHG